MSKSPTGRRWCWLLLGALAAGVIWSTREAHVNSAAVPAPVSTLRSKLDEPEAAARSAKDSDANGAPAASRQSDNALFTFVHPRNAAELDAVLPAPARDIRYVRLNTALISGKRSPFWQRPGAGRIELPLPDGTSVVVAIDGSEMLGPDRFTSSGHIEGRPASRALFAWHRGFLHASIEDPQRGTFALRAATAELAQFYQVDPALVPPCGGERRPSPAERRRAAEMDTPNDAPIAPAAAAASDTARVEVHVMMVYTQAVLSTLSGEARANALQSAFDLAIAKVNSAFEASLITARVKLVKVMETSYNESASADTKVQDDALTALEEMDDGKMDEIHAARDAAGADTVMLALNRRDFVSSGLSFLLDEPGASDNSHFAFSVVQYSSIAGTNVVPHELGHVLGCAHDRQNALSGPGAFSYSYGYRFVGADGRQYHDIMSYPPGTELSYFSNPKVLLPEPVGAPLGIAAGQPGESNTALTIERTALPTSLYRLQPAAPSGASLINVATRAFVGVGDQVLIGGFVVNSPQPARLLVRAAGPALTQFGVTGALGDPVLRIFSGATLAAENDNWTVPAGVGRAASATEIMTAASASGAFAFAAGSADAAVLVTLPSGAYTAVVEGASQSTGYGLIEAYQVDRGAPAIVNLATRGYAGRDGQEMFGGFVVHGAPGTTKRVLVRVLGPTLARPPFNLTGTLDDPEMEVRDASGDVIVKNDDWSSDSEGGVGAENDFQPVVKTYDEKAIFATGHAPTNRREPGVMMELPPGSYTIVVRPFEARSSNPLRDQPAVPGVGIVEVYEITNQ
jgi:hypothetical protein